ncbi:hypothetical protein D922_02665 [Enterococcus faecalis 06-MB-DW-09]|nr:hypothetical protein D922_02665 [Enterococcus faecalis 06-MB-DW-09]
MIKINVESTQIPIEIGGLNVTIDATAEWEAKYKKLKEDFDKKTAAISKKTEDGSLTTETADKQYFNLAGKSIDAILGEGTAKHLLTISPNPRILSGCYLSIRNALDNELDLMLVGVHKEKINRYLKG